MNEARPSGGLERCRSTCVMSKGTQLYSQILYRCKEHQRDYELIMSIPTLGASVELGHALRHGDGFSSKAADSGGVGSSGQL